MKILVTGSNGYIATSIYNAFKGSFNITTINRDSFDLCDREVTTNFLKDKFYDVVIHTATVGGSRLLTESSAVLENNLKMFFNLYDNRDKFNKFISFGSGAEVNGKDTPYGMSKRVINQFIQNTNNFFNLRIYGVFDENEIDTRFIKSNIYRYIKRANLVIHEDKEMDFIYMRDLLEIIQYFILNNNIKQKSVDCVYKEKYKLSNIANIINELDIHKSIIDINVNYSKSYIGGFHNLCIPEVGLTEGIKKTYNKIKNNL
jgi:nucleoside-diphosphate-sugar epimerase